MTTPSSRRTTRSQSCACVRGRVLHEDRFVAADLVEHAQAIGGERAAGFDEVDDRVGHAERDHHFDRAGELDDVAVDFVLGEIALGDVAESWWRCGGRRDRRAS